MINFNENLYKTQWLDLVFQNRNKSYGAYQLRKHYKDTTTKAFIYASLLFSSTIILLWVYGQIAQNFPAIEIPQVVDPVEINLIKVHEPKPLPPVKIPPAKPIPLKSIQYTTVVVAPASETNIEPPNQVKLSKSVISNIATTGADAPGTNPLEILKGDPAGTGIKETPSETAIFSIASIDKYPEFPGGQEAFIRFLRKNLRYPGNAVENGIQGKVILSFIIERNGDLSQIKVMRGIGSGCDEEAMRVLQKSPRWNPGEQNKQNVRVAYTLPINFSLSN